MKLTLLKKKILINDMSKRIIGFEVYKDSKCLLSKVRIEMYFLSRQKPWRPEMLPFFCSDIEAGCVTQADLPRAPGRQACSCAPLHMAQAHF